MLKADGVLHIQTLSFHRFTLQCDRARCGNSISLQEDHGYQQAAISENENRRDACAFAPKRGMETIPST
jgi:hypothetical protein